MAKLTSKGGKGSGNWGHAGRPGKVGGSAPRDIETNTPSNDNYDDLAMRPTFAIGWSTPEMDVVKRDMEGDINEFRDRRSYFAHRIIQTVKKRNAELSRRSGVPLERVSDIVKEWSYESNGTEQSDVIHDAAVELFGDKIGTHLSDWQKNERLNRKTGTEVAYGQRAREKTFSIEDAAAVMDAMYKYTQAYFRGKGITHLHLYRGIQYRGTSSPDLRVGDTVSLNENALSSWTLDRGVAKEFSESSIKGTTSAIVEADVPVERILSIATTGFGTLSEDEVVVLGSVADDKVFVEDVSKVE